MTTLIKYVEESRRYTFDFSDYAEIIAGDTIASVAVSATPSGLVLGSGIISGTSVKVVISGGTASTSYVVSAIATTSSGAIIEGKGRLIVE